MYKKITAVAMVAVLTAMTASAGITQFKDSADFQYKYEMDVAPETQDLDSGGGRDWFWSGTPTVSSGFATNTATDQIYRGDFGDGGQDSIWRELVSAGSAADWTMEIRVSKTGGTQGTDGWFGIATANKTESNSSRLDIMDDRINLQGIGDYMIGTDFSTGYHTIRIAHDAVDNANYYWIDGTLLNADLNTAIGGGNGTGFDNSTFIGDFSGSLAGDYSIDYMRLDSTAYAIPEPATLGMIAAFGGGLLFIRRKLMM